MADKDIATTSSTGPNAEAETFDRASPYVYAEGSASKDNQDSSVEAVYDGELKNGALEHHPVPQADSTLSATTSSGFLLSGLTSLSTLTAVHPKKFSAVNINKKFLEKNSSTSGPSQPPISSSSSKANGPISRPTVPPSTSHSRLVTTKLTASLQTSSITGPGWSRPSSATPLTPSPSAIITNPLAAPLAAPQPATSPLPQPGRTTQPQPRSNATVPSQKEIAGGSGKAVWGRGKPAIAGGQKLDTRSQNDFPTAAEVASAGKAKLEEKKEVEEMAAVNRQARMEEADTFRGVHLDPNAHHWDEMEEDDDNFLDGVIEFGDGRQYQVQSADLTNPVASSSTATTSLTGKTVLSSPITDTMPVSKEERFADDFDRSWPRSRPSPKQPQRDIQFQGQPHQHPVLTTVSPQNAHFSHDSARVLFNERSNRLEPITHPTHRPPQVAHLAKRGSGSDSASSHSEARSPRDASNQLNGVHLLQKTTSHGSDFPFRSRGSSVAEQPSNAHGDRKEVETTRREFASQQPSHAPGPNLDSKNVRQHEITQSPEGSTFGLGERERVAMEEKRGSARDLPKSQTSSAGASSRAPRHMPPPPPPSHHQPRVTLADPISSTIVSATSPVSSKSPLLSPDARSPIQAVSPLSPLLNIDDVRKDVMQSAAARAKQRRQQEEEEREKEKDRARKKAAELEKKIRAAETAKQASENKGTEAVFSKENASGTLPPQRSPVIQTSTPFPHVLQRTPSLSAGTVIEPARHVSSRRLSAVAPPLITEPHSDQAMSWRTKTSALSPTVHIEKTRPPDITFPLSTLNDVTLMDSEGLEIIDFSELSTFAGVPDGLPSLAQPPPGPNVEHLATSPSITITGIKADPWRRQNPKEPAQDKALVVVASEEATPKPPVASVQDGLEITAPTGETRSQNVLSPPNPEASLPADPLSPLSAFAPHQSYQRSPRIPNSFKEPKMSALDDVMSRIKGALDGMQATEPAREVFHVGASNLSSPITAQKVMSPRISQKLAHPPKESRWVPPAFRSTAFDYEQTREVFDVTGSDPPEYSQRASELIIVTLPKVARLVEPLSKKQVVLSKPSHGTVRMENLSWEPPVEGMKRDLSLNDVLFRKPSVFKGKTKYRVVIPKKSRLPDSGRGGPRVNPMYAPTSKPGLLGAFGRTGIADGISTWRKSTATSPTTVENPGNTAKLETSTQSPTVESLDRESVTSIPQSNASTSSKADGLPKSRSQPKMPAGSAVAFYRDTPEAVISEAKTFVNFIVTSELEDLAQQNQMVQRTWSTLDSGAFDSAPSDAREAFSPVANGILSQPTSPRLSAPSLVHNKTDSSGDFKEREPSTPPRSQADATWSITPVGFPVKESPARAPDPEHLKAVWSQPSEKTRLPVVNSLEGIADDLTALPFTLQDVKSEDGETPPPPNPMAPSRISLHDVTRAFQQVPSSNTPSSHRNTLPPPSIPSVRQPTYVYPANSVMRPPYGSYPSPIMSHSPSPTMMYPHHMVGSPVSSRPLVNGHSPMFSPPMWMPVQGSPAQNMMRPMASPYPAQLMPYPSPNTPYSQHPNNLPGSPSQQNGAANRGRNMPMMSPVMPHSVPNVQMYAASPVLMHAPVMQMSPGHGYLAIHPNRSQSRPDNHGPIQQASPHGTPYSGVPPASYMRTAW